MGIFATGNAPDNITPNGLLGSAAFMNNNDLAVQYAPVMTLDMLRGNSGIESKYIIVDDAGIIGLFRYDSADTTTNDDNKDILVTIDGRRYKRRFQIRNYTPTSGSDTNLATGEIVFDANGIWVKTGASTVMLAQYVRSGTTGNRPALTSAHTGFQYYDTSVGKPIWWNGSAWRDAANSVV